MKPIGTVNKKNEQKLKAFLVKQNDTNIKPNSIKVTKPRLKP